MNGLYITVDGVVGTEPKQSSWNGNPILSFRLVANERRFDRLRGTWIDAHASWMTVSCFRDLARNVHTSVRKGDRLIVHGKMRVKDYVGDDGVQRTVVTIEADSIGHNLIFGTSTFKPSRSPAHADEQIRAQADELVRELAAEPIEDLRTLLALRGAESEDSDREAETAPEPPEDCGYPDGPEPPPEAEPAQETEPGDDTEGIENSAGIENDEGTENDGSTEHPEAVDASSRRRGGRRRVLAALPG